MVPKQQAKSDGNQKRYLGRYRPHPDAVRELFFLPASMCEIRNAPLAIPRTAIKRTASPGDSLRGETLDCAIQARDNNEIHPWLRPEAWIEPSPIYN